VSATPTQGESPDSGTRSSSSRIIKSIVTLLFGIAMADDTIRSLDSPVLDYFPEYKDLQTPQRRKIRLCDVLPMTSGLHWDEWSEPYGDIQNSETAMDARRIAIDTSFRNPWIHRAAHNGDIAAGTRR
jgi:CubicO group peptidase (beta-lactamase class C family)